MNIKSIKRNNINKKSLANTAIFIANGVMMAQLQNCQLTSQAKEHTNYEQNIKIIKQQLSVDKFDSLKTCIKENDYKEIGRVLSWKDVADSVRKNIDFETIAKSVCKQVK